MVDFQMFDSEQLSYLGEGFPGSLVSGAGAGVRGWANDADVGISVAVKATMKAGDGDRRNKGGGAKRV